MADVRAYFGALVNELDQKKVWLKAGALPRLEISNLQGLRVECDGPVRFFMPDAKERVCFGRTFSQSSQGSILRYQLADSEKPNELLQMIFVSEHAPEGIEHSFTGADFETGLFAGCYAYDARLNFARGFVYCDPASQTLSPERDANRIIAEAFKHHGWDVRIREPARYGRQVVSAKTDFAYEWARDGNE